MHENGPVLAIDIGGTHTRVALLPSVDRPALELVARFTTADEYGEQLSALVAGARAAGVTPVGVGISFGGRIDSTGRSISVSINLRAYEGRPLPVDLETALGCPVRIAHDAVCGLLGEHAYGALRGADRCGYVTLSTGTGCAIRLGRGTQFVVTTSEAGHQLRDGQGLSCTCGQRGCLQTQTGGRLLEERVGRPLAEVDDARFWHAYGEAAGFGLGNFALSAGIEAVALGGSVILSRPEIWPALRGVLAERFTYQPLTVVPAALGEQAPLIGAAVLLATAEAHILH
jgi:glucokinase